MTLTVKAAALSGFVQTLKALDAILDKAVAQAETRKIQPEVLLSARLAPDMLAFTRQIQLCCDFAKNSMARLAGSESTRFPDEERSFPELKERIARTLACIETVDDAALEAGLAREITFPLGPSATATLKGDAYITRFVVPNFYFHATTAYNILRQNGFQIGKQDFLKDVFA